MSQAEANFNQTSVEEHLEKRILVLGSAPHTRQISAYSWDRLPKYLNVADYDVVILNLEPLLDKHFAASLNIETLPSWEQFARLVFSHASELIIIGMPIILIGYPFYTDISKWLPPLLPQFIVDSGEEIRNIDSEFAYYFKYVSRWFFHTSSDLNVKDYLWSHYLSLIHPQTNDLDIEYHPLAQTRFQQAVAFRMKFQALGIATRSFSYSHEDQTVLKISGDVICLPIPRHRHLAY